MVVLPPNQSIFSFSISQVSFLRPGECLTSLTKDNSANFSSENGKMKPFGESIF